jgi:hypothetical protein
MGWCGVDWSGSGYGQVDKSYECGNDPSGSIKCREFLMWLYKWWPLE